MMKPRSFNIINVDYDRGVVRKSSTDTEKLKHEILFYLNAPEKIKNVMPKLYRYSGDFSWYEMEYLEWDSLSDLVNQNRLSPEDWAKVFISINETYQLFNETSSNADFSYLYQVIIKKALDRAEALQNKELRNVFFGEPIVNGVKRDGLAKLLILNSGVLFKVPSQVGPLHGDLCFSNIMISKDLSKIKVLDPKGGFDSPSTLGPVAYDIAKVSQSCYSWYDKIVDGQYKLTRSENGYGLLPLGDDWSGDAQLGFKSMLDELDLTSDDARVLAGLMLAGTPALHLDDHDRATALALNAVLLLSSDV